MKFMTNIAIGGYYTTKGVVQGDYSYCYIDCSKSQNKLRNALIQMQYARYFECKFR